MSSAVRRPASSKRRVGIRRVPVVAAVSALALTACAAPSIEIETADPTASAESAQIKGGLFGKDNVDFSRNVIFNVDEGRFTDVKVEGPDGELAGQFKRGGTRWVGDPSQLDFGKTYKITSTAVDLRGNEVVRKGKFSTIEPSEELTADFYTSDGGTYGVGMPVQVTFNRPVEDKAAVERRLSVKTDGKKPVVGAWKWESDTKVSYRPKEFWPANTKVTVDANLRGVESSEGVYGLQNVQHTMNIGDSMVSVVDASTYNMKVWRNGELIREMPITTGAPGWLTRSGIKVIISQERQVVMDGLSIGISENDDDYYQLDVEYAMRLTWSGEYVHAAPWSVGSQGRANVSHGCVGMSTGNAAWYFSMSKIGDVLEVKNTGRSQDLGNGITVWNESWQDWKAGSALSGSA